MNFFLTLRKTNKYHISLSCFIVETPGIAFYTTVIPDARNAIGDAVSNGWPALVFVIISALLAGMIYWISVSKFDCSSF